MGDRHKLGGSGNTGREVLGKGSVINPHHEGPVGGSRRPYEERVEEYSSRSSKTPQDLRREREERIAAERAAKQAELDAKEAELERKRQEAREAAEAKRSSRERGY